MNWLSKVTVLLLVLSTSLLAKESPPPQTQELAQPTSELLLREIRYDGTLSDAEARFVADLDLESLTRAESSMVLFDGEVALLTTKLPPGLRIVREGNLYRIVASKQGRYKFKLELVAKITRAEPWNQASFVGPVAAIASVNARANGAAMELQLLSGTVLQTEQKDGITRARGYLGPDRTVSLRWQSKAAEAARKAVVTCDTAASAQITPTVVKFTTELRYTIAVGAVPTLRIALPTGQALTKLQGAQIRDWQVKADGDRQVLTVEFIKPVEKTYALTLFSEQSVDSTPQTAQLVPPQPLDIARESGGFSVSAEDVLVETESAAGLRQVNAPAGTFAGYQFYARPFALALKLKRIEALVTVATRITTRLEESRLLASHAITLTVEKAGIYAIELSPFAGFVVADVRGEGIEDWKAREGKLMVNFSSRVLATRKIEVFLEQSHKTFPEQIEVVPLHVAGASKETAQIGAAATPGIRLKTSEMNGLREIPTTSLASRSDELLAFVADTGDWKLKLAAERLSSRLVADIFNLVTIGDGLVGGSASIRYAIINQGVQEFRVQLPAHWKNIEFTGPNIRRKEPKGDIWTVTLQDKAWGAYTLVVTYDFQFDPHKDTLPVGGIRALDVERETGSVAVTSAANLEIRESKLAAGTNAAPAITTLRRIDEFELAEADRALITRPVLQAFRYDAPGEALTLEVTRFKELALLDGVADRTQLTTVLTDEGQMLTQASFMVKNNDKQFQKFTMPDGAVFWSCYVSGQAVKPERDGKFLLVPLPRGANRDQAFAVDITYATKIGSLKSVMPHKLPLVAPITDMQTTYAEWEVYVPQTHNLMSFDGNMSVARGTTYGLRDAWRSFLAFYGELLSEWNGVLIGCVAVTFLVWLLVVAIRRGKIIQVAGGLAVIAVLAGMMLPALNSSRGKARRATCLNNLKQIGVAMKLYSRDNADKFPTSLDELLSKGMVSEKDLIDPDTGGRLVYVGGGRREGELNSNEILAYSPPTPQGNSVLYADGRVGFVKNFVAPTSKSVTDAVTIDAQLQIDKVRQAQQLALAPTTPKSEPRSRFVQGTNGAAWTHRSDGGNVLFADGHVQFQKGFVPPLYAGRGPSGKPGADAPAGVSGATNWSESNLSYHYGAFGTTEATQPAEAGGLFTPAAVAGMIAPGAFGLSPVLAGIRPIRIELPRTGDRYVFTKVLNVKDEPLTVGAVAMDANAFQAMRGSLQAIAFAVGGLVLWLQTRKLSGGREASALRRPKASSLLVTVGLALMVGSVAHLLISMRWLHVFFILAAPAILIWLLVWLIRRYWPRKAPINGTDVANGSAGAPPALAAIALLLALSGVATADEPAGVSILSGSYVGIVRERVAEFEATLDLSVAKPDQTFVLFNEDVAVSQFSATPGDAALVRLGQRTAVKLPRRGNATLRIKFLVKLTGDVTKREIGFAIPPALSSKVSLTIDEPEAAVEFPTAVSFKAVAASGSERPGTRLDAVIGSGERVEVRWTPRVKSAAETAATVFCQSATLVSFTGGVIQNTSRLDFQVTQGELRTVRVGLPAQQRLLRVEGDGIRTWEIKEEGGEQILSVELIKGVASSNYVLKVVTERVLDALPTQAVVKIPRALDVRRETGLVALSGSEELGITIDKAGELQRVDAEEFARASAAPNPPGVVSAYRFRKPEFDLGVRVEAVQPQIEAVARNRFHIGTESTSINAQIDYGIKRAGVFLLRLAIPTGYSVASVQGEKVSQWSEKTEPETRNSEPGTRNRVLEVTLKERAIGAYTLKVNLIRWQRELPKTIEVVGVQPLGVHKLSGFVSVATELGVQAKTESFDGLAEIPANAAPEGMGGSGALAFKFIAGEAGTQAKWKLTVATETVESWVRAEVVNWVTLTESLISGRAVIQYDIANAPVKELRVRVPASFKNVEINGANIRRRDQEGEEWRVQLQSKAIGPYTLTVTWEQPWSLKEPNIDFAGVETLGTERETGAVAVVARPPLQVEGKPGGVDLIPVDVRELPAWAGQPAETTVLAYRYLRQGYKLALAAKRFEEAEVLQALVDDVRLTTVVADDGQMMTRVNLSIRNNARQYLAVTMPENTQVWSAFVSGRAVRPSVREHKLLLPLERGGADNAAVPVELTYVTTNTFPRSRGSVGLATPAVDVPVKNVRWDMYLPIDYRYGDFGGTMVHEAEVVQQQVRFSASDYERAEGEKAAMLKRDVASALDATKRKLAGGNLKDATESLSNLRQIGRVAEEKEFKQVEKQLREAQSFNLLTNNYQTAYGAWIAPNDSSGNAPVARQLDQKAAEQQWDKLQQAQELAVTRVQPLRVNLPTHGVRHSFAQVLQTEVNKPMTVQFSATTTRSMGWPMRIGASLAGFVAMWVCVAALLHRRKV